MASIFDPIKAAVDAIIAKFLAALDPFIGPVKGLVKLVLKFKDTFSSVVDGMESIISTTQDIVAEVRTFSIAPHVKSRVVNIPRAVEQLKEFWTSLQDLGTEFKKLWETLKAAATGSESEELSAEADGIDEIKQGLTKIGGKLGRLGEKALVWVGFILMIFSSFTSTIDAVNAILSDILTIVQGLDHLDALFLQQNNKRKTLTIAPSKDGTGPTSINIRVGGLHS